MQFRFLYIVSIALFILGSSQKIAAQVYRPQQNLIANGDFMSRDPQGRPLRWISGKELQTAILSVKERHGTRKDDYTLEAADTSSKLMLLVRSEKMLANPGTSYFASAWVKPAKGNPASFNIEFWGQNDRILKANTVMPTDSLKWQKLTVALKAPDSCTHVTVSITSGAAQTGLSYWDDVFLSFDQPYNPQIKNKVRELFFDNYRIEEMVDVIRQVNAPVKTRPLINPTEPWEGNSVYIYGTVLKDARTGTYKMWYTSFLNKHYYLCYATSTDGYKWLKPKLGIFDFNGSKQNNICHEGGGTLVFDPVDKDPSRRYKMMAFNGEKSNFGYNVYFSPDGLHWTHYPKPVLPYGDVSNVAYNQDEGLFIATTKQRMLVSNTSVTPGKNDRCAFVSVSKDFIHWSAPGEPNSPYTLAVEGDYADDMLTRSKGGLEANIYGMTVYPYENIYIGFPWMFDIMTYNVGEFASVGDGQIQPQVASSRDLRHWSRPAREPVIPLGKAGAWDDGTIYNCATLQVTDKNMSVYFGAMNLPHGGSTTTQTQYARIAKASWRRDGMVSMYNGGDDEGTVLTKPIQFTGSLLKVNTRLKAGGYLKVELLGEDGKVLDGYSASQATAISGDQLNAVVSWKGNRDLSKVKGKILKIRFIIKGGEFYSYWFE